MRSGHSVSLSGQVYKNPNLTDAELDDAAKIFLPNLDQSTFNASELAESRNVTAGLLTLPQDNVNLSFAFFSNGSQLLNVSFPYPTSDIGEFDSFIQFNSSSNLPAPGTAVRRLTVYTNGTNTGNSSSYLVPNTGLTIVSDIDDILRGLFLPRKQN